MKKWYQEMFVNYADEYDKEDFTMGTEGEVDFIEKEIDYEKDVQILDIGCGTGRHAIELARRGYSVTGVDLSESMINKAREKAEIADAEVDFQIADARNLPFQNQFDLVIMICEGAFCLMETDEMNFQILESAARSLKKEGKFIFTALNGLFPLYNNVKDFINSNSIEKVSGEYKFDIMTFRDRSTHEVLDNHGNKRFFECEERYYVPSEISWLLKSLNFNKIEIYGCKLGDFSRDSSLTAEDFEMLIIAEY